MKKLICCVLVIVVLVGLAGCANPQVGEITPVPLTAEQQEILDIVGEDTSGAHVLQFDYKTTEELRFASFWLDVYEYGTLTDTVLAFPMWDENAHIMEGRMVVTNTNYTVEPVWSLRKTDPSGVTAVSRGGTLYLEEAYSGYACTAITQPAQLRLDEDMVLAVYYINTGADTALQAFEVSTVQNNPGVLSSQRYAVLLKCRFSREMEPEQATAE